MYCLLCHFDLSISNVHSMVYVAFAFPFASFMQRRLSLYFLPLLWNFLEQLTTKLLNPMDVQYCNSSEHCKANDWTQPGAGNKGVVQEWGACRLVVGHEAQMLRGYVGVEGVSQVLSPTLTFAVSSGVFLSPRRRRGHHVGTSFYWDRYWERAQQRVPTRQRASLVQSARDQREGLLICKDKPII